MPLLGVNVLLVAGGELLVLGGSFLVNGAVALSRGSGVSETVVGLTIVAVGTSLPEIVTSVVAALKQQSDVAFGNVVRSNTCNLLGIGGATALIAPSRVPSETVFFDATLMIAVSLHLVIFAATGLRIGRKEGATVLVGYFTYRWMLLP